MNYESHEERADRIISMLPWLEGLPPHRRATLKNMMAAGMREAADEKEHEVIEYWKAGFASQGFTLHPGLTPEQNVAEWARRIEASESALAVANRLYRELLDAAYEATADPYSEGKRSKLMAVVQKGVTEGTASEKRKCLSSDLHEAGMKDGKWWCYVCNAPIKLR